ncbi:hypothetical protein JTE90_011685 [Oedothorax gibbosus]|uniref:MYND-type domain-containing protein n=1 Tax=Oedothorax gibbosus TaxID=931172 RepID=A0AAV6UST5_9ARAC|nr:hypothetical protein JTE90_011685 [Oedothorax gibbosus]
MSSFQLGELILTSKPYAYVLSNACRSSRCDFCFKKQKDLKRCSQCSFLFYCDKSCQEKSWDVHKAECKFIKKAKPKEPTASMRLIALILFKIKKLGREFPVEDVYGRKMTFQSLMSHAEDIQKSLKSCQQMMALIGTLIVYIGSTNIPLPSDFVEIFGKMCINTFSICDNEMQSIGSGLYLGASVFDHSCQPDAEVVFDGINLTVRAIKDIPHRNINKIYISYIDQMQLTEDRQNALKEQYYVLCQCQRCLSPHLDELMTKLTDSGRENQVSEFNAQLEHIKQMKKDKVGPSTIYNACLNQLALHEVALADTHLCKVKTLEIAFDICIESNQWADAITLGKQLLKPYRLYYGQYHPTLGIHLFKLGKIQALQNLPSASTTLQEAENVLKVTHGETHHLYQELLKFIYESRIVFPTESLALQ